MTERGWDRARRAATAVAVASLAGLMGLTACSSDDATTTGGDEGSPTTADQGTRTTVADPVAEVTGPVTGGTYDIPFNPMPSALAEQYDYTEEEYFLTGTATAYAATAPLGEDGEWEVEPSTTADYTTRILVRRPADATAFNGTVVVEWLNVSSGMDADPDFGQAAPELLREGYAWVGVSAQKVGVEGGGARIPIEGFDVQALKEWDPERYGPLSHPGDEYSYDIYTQVGQILREPGEVDPLDGLEPTLLLAVGESQSAGRMVTYADAVQPLAGVYNGILVHSRGGQGTALSSDPASAVPSVARIRTDLDVPVLQLQMETDLIGLGSLNARQDDTDMIRTWEVAGTAHADQNTLDYGAASGREWAPDASLDLSSLCPTINEGPQRYLVRRAIDALNRWAGGGEAPPNAQVIEISGNVIVRDDDGIAVGGIRTPAVDAPIATLTGEPAPGASVICSLFGGTTPFTAEQLAERYPTHADYVAAVTESADAAVEAGFLLPVDAEEIVNEAEAAPIPS